MLLRCVALNLGRFTKSDFGTKSAASAALQAQNLRPDFNLKSCIHFIHIHFSFQSLHWFVSCSPKSGLGHKLMVTFVGVSGRRMVDFRQDKAQMEVMIIIKIKRKVLLL